MLWLSVTRNVLILKVEKMYFSWIVSFIISFMSIIVDLVNCRIENSFMQRSFYTMIKGNFM